METESATGNKIISLDSNGNVTITELTGNIYLTDENSLYQACVEGKTNVVKFILSSDNKIEFDEMTAIKSALENKHTEICLLLIQFIDDVTVLNCDLFKLACRHGNLIVYQELVKKIPSEKYSEAIKISIGSAIYYHQVEILKFIKTIDFPKLDHDVLYTCLLGYSDKPINEKQEVLEVYKWLVDNYPHHSDKFNAGSITHFCCDERIFEVVWNSFEKLIPDIKKRHEFIDDVTNSAVRVSKQGIIKQLIKIIPVQDIAKIYVSHLNDKNIDLGSFLVESGAVFSDEDLLSMIKKLMNKSSEQTDIFVNLMQINLKLYGKELMEEGLCRCNVEVNKYIHSKVDYRNYISSEGLTFNLISSLANQSTVNILAQLTYNRNAESILTWLKSINISPSKDEFSKYAKEWHLISNPVIFIYGLENGLLSEDEVDKQILEKFRKRNPINLN